VLFGIVLVTTICVVYLRVLFPRWFSQHKHEPADETKRKSIKQRINDYLESFFREWGTVMARRRLIVLLVSAVIIVALAIGIIMLQVTTDPVEIWAAPHSRSRQEKDFFDANFQPFYRTNQVFIKSVGIESFEWTQVIGSENVSILHTFGPAFNRTFLNAVFDLQKEIESVNIFFVELPRPLLSLSSRLN
jgi:Niemann-Pick C1 protein